MATQKLGYLPVFYICRFQLTKNVFKLRCKSHIDEYDEYLGFYYSTTFIVYLFARVQACSELTWHCTCNIVMNEKITCIRYNLRGFTSFSFVYQ